jgi:hypothetical protein
MKRWEIAFGVLFLLAAQGFVSMARKIRKACFL